ncbi:cell division protein FtsL [Bacillus pinisoli]|uniref:cell division protein FtsL n=1 Tax=Bacillus pinisoli TaxID=2901866 RepID=UPI001FF69803|nr:cell division protein FtsL [Bacillus pinisoli]
MSNLAYQIQQRRKIEEEQQYQQQAGQQIQKKLKVTFGEKVLFLMFAVMVLIGSIVMVSNSAKIYSVNRDISKLQTSIDTQAKVNADLELQVMELSTYERIWAKAQELGLMLNENNVKVVQD